MSIFFITASGTGIGKTFLTSVLAAQLRAKGQEVHALKPLISGFAMEDAEHSDTGHLLRAQGLPVTEENIEAISPWRFAAALSPDMAAAAENLTVEFAGLIDFCRRGRSGISLIEGVGGVMSPVTSTHTVLDWMEALACPVMLVGGSYLGALSHTLTAAHAVRSRGLELRGVILSESESQEVGLARTAESLRRFLPSAVQLRAIARRRINAGLDSSLQVWESMDDLTGLLL